MCKGVEPNKYKSPPCAPTPIPDPGHFTTPTRTCTHARARARRTCSVVNMDWNTPFIPAPGSTLVVFDELEKALEAF